MSNSNPEHDSSRHSSTPTSPFYNSQSNFHLGMSTGASSVYDLPPALRSGINPHAYYNQYFSQYIRSNEFNPFHSIMPHLDSSLSYHNPTQTQQHSQPYDYSTSYPYSQYAAQQNPSLSHFGPPGDISRASSISSSIMQDAYNAVPGLYHAQSSTDSGPGSIYFPKLSRSNGIGPPLSPTGPSHHMDYHSHHSPLLNRASPRVRLHQEHSKLHPAMMNGSTANAMTAGHRRERPMNGDVMEHDRSNVRSRDHGTSEDNGESEL